MVGKKGCGHDERENNTGKGVVCCVQARAYVWSEAKAIWTRWDGTPVKTYLLSRSHQHKYSQTCVQRDS